MRMCASYGRRLARRDATTLGACGSADPVALEHARDGLAVDPRDACRLGEVAVALLEQVFEITALEGVDDLLPRLFERQLRPGQRQARLGLLGRLGDDGVRLTQRVG